MPLPLFLGGDKGMRIPRNQILIGDALTRLKELPDGSVHCVVTSPPYWGLRDYGTGRWEGGDPECDHKMNHGIQGKQGDRAGRTFTSEAIYKSKCGKCSALRIDKQIGLEQTPSEYVEKMVEIFREIRRVLRPDGTLWLNLGDSYAANRGYQVPDSKHTDVGNSKGMKAIDIGLKPKDLVGIPWRVAFALQADGWYLRSDIIWHKPNPMPESVTDRPTTAHEYIFLLTKAERYFYDAEAIKETAICDRMRGPALHGSSDTNGNSGLSRREFTGSRNKRSVWTIASESFKGAHFATFPQKLVEPCIQAGTSEDGVCASCGAPRRRVVERKTMVIGPSKRTEALGEYGRTSPSGSMIKPPTSKTIGWKATCECGAGVQPAIVLDPFGGSGTTGLVASRLGRDYILIELNPESAKMAEQRTAQGKLL